MQERVINFILKFKYLVVILIPALSLFIFFLNLDKAGFETDWKIWFDKDSYIIKNYDHFKESFGNDGLALIVIKNEKGIFNPTQIKNIEKITKLLWETKSVARVDSITNFQYVHVSKTDKDEIIVENLIPKLINTKILKQREKIALSEPDLLGRIISKDAKTTVIMVKMVYFKNIDSKKILNLSDDIDKILRQNSLDGTTYIQAGVQRYSKDTLEIMKENMKFLLPLFFLCILVILALVFKNIWCVVLPILVIIFSLLATLGLIFAFGYKLNTLVSMFPIFLVAIAIADSVHFLWLWIDARLRGYENKKAVLFSLNKNLLAAFLTSITTFFGFCTLGLSKIVPLQVFGLVTALGVLIAFIISATFLPAFLLVVNPKIKAIKAKNKSFKKYTNFIIKYHKAIIVSTFVLMVFFLAGLSKISIDTDFTKQFAKESKLRQDMDFVEKNIGGTIPIEIIIDSKKANGINEPKFLKTVERFTQEFRKKFHKTTSSNSIVNVLKKYEQLMHEGNENFYKIPNSKDLVSQYLLLYSLSLPQGMGINSMFDIKRRHLRLTNIIILSSELEKLKMYDWTKAWWAKTEYSATLEGTTMIAGFMRIELSKTMIKSILLGLAIVSFVLFLSFRKKLYFLASLAPNMLPLIMAVGLGGWLGISIDLSIAIVAVMIIAIAVDDTVHFLVKYQIARKSGKTVAQSIEISLLLSANAIIITTLILVLGFSLFLLSDLALYKNFGLVSSVSLITAMILDLAFLPALLHFLEKRKVS